MQREQLQALAAQHDGVTLDLTPGDGRPAHRVALARPGHLVVAVAARREQVAEFSTRAAKNAAHGGASNLLYVSADPRSLPQDLARIAGQILVVLPPAALLRAILMGDRSVIGGIVSACAPGGTISIVLNDAEDDPHMQITPLYARDIIAPSFAEAGARISKSAWMTPADVTKFEAKWLRSLPSRAGTRLFDIEARVRTTSRSSN
jgi:hypothetical protein